MTRGRGDFGWGLVCANRIPFESDFVRTWGVFMDGLQGYARSARGARLMSPGGGGIPFGCSHTFLAPSYN
jgi:hypothetical protein